MTFHLSPGACYVHSWFLFLVYELRLEVAFGKCLSLRQKERWLDMTWPQFKLQPREQRSLLLLPQHRPECFPKARCLEG